MLLGFDQMQLSICSITKIIGLNLNETLSGSDHQNTFVSNMTYYVLSGTLAHCHQLDRSDYQRRHSSHNAFCRWTHSLELTSDELREIQAVSTKPSDNCWKYFCSDNISVPVPSTLEVYTIMRYGNSHFTFPLTYTKLGSLTVMMMKDSHGMVLLFSTEQKKCNCMDVE